MVIIEGETRKVKMMKKAIIVVCVIAIVILGYAGFTKICEITSPNLTDTINKAVMVYSESSHIIDENGNYSEDLAQKRRETIEEVFVKDRFDYYNNRTTLDAILESYTDQSDVVLDNKVVSYRIWYLWRIGNKAHALITTEVLQKYIPYDAAERRYKAWLGISKETNKVDLIKNNGQWQVLKMESKQYQSGTPEEMWNAENQDEFFYTRKEACEYLNSLTIKDIKSKKL